MAQLHNYYVTFGPDHDTLANRVDYHGYVRVMAEDLEEARGQVFAVFGDKFCTVTPEDTFRYERADGRPYYHAGELGVICQGFLTWFPAAQVSYRIIGWDFGSEKELGN